MTPLFYRTCFVELVAPGVAGGNTQTSFQFTSQTFLRTKLICSIETFTNADMPYSPGGNPLVTPAELVNWYLTLYYPDPTQSDTPGNWINQRQLVSFHRTINGSNPYVRDLFTMNPANILWEQSNLQSKFAGGLGNTVNTSFLFDVGYKG